MQGLADGVQELEFGIRVRWMGQQGEGEDGIELMKLGDHFLALIPKIPPGFLKSLFLAILECSDNVEAGEIFKLLEIHFYSLLKLLQGLDPRRAWLKYPTKYSFERRTLG